MALDVTQTQGDSVGKLINKLDQVQGEIDDELVQIQGMEHHTEATNETRRSSRATRGQRQNPCYDEE